MEKKKEQNICSKCNFEYGKYYPKKKNKNFCTKCNHIYFRYKISVKDFLELLEIQKYKCAICRTQFKSYLDEKIQIDHIHLPGDKNSGIGKNVDSV